MELITEIFATIFFAVGLILYVVKQQKKYEIIAESYQYKDLKQRKELGRKINKKIKKINKLIAEEVVDLVKWEDRIQKLNIEIISTKNKEKSKKNLEIELQWFENELKKNENTRFFNFKENSK